MNISQEACKWDKLSQTERGFINALMSIALVKSINRCIRACRIPASHMSNQFRSERGAGLIPSENFEMFLFHDMTVSLVSTF